MACSKSLVCRLLLLRGELIRVSAGSRVGSYHCIISFCALLFFFFFFADGCVDRFCLGQRCPFFPSPRAVQPIQPAESPPHGQNYSLTPTAPLPPPSLPPFPPNVLQLRDNRDGDGAGGKD